MQPQPDPYRSPHMPDALRALLPQADQTGMGEGAVGRLVKPTYRAAVWQCPDCGQEVQPHSLGKGWLPSAWCTCPGGTVRQQRSHVRWAMQDAKHREEANRHAMLAECDLTDCGMTFDNWRADTPAREKALTYAKRMLQRIAGGSWAFWWGPYGCGKTHLAHAIAARLVLDHGRSARVVNWLRQLREIQMAWSNGTKEGPLWDAMIKTSVLFLDDFDKQLPRPGDLGKPHVTLPKSWYMESLYWIIDARYAACRPTILIANQPYGDVEQVLQAIGGTAVDAVLSRFNRNGAIMLDWSVTGISEFKPAVEMPQF